MPNYSNDIKNDKKKNIPSLIPPIINSVLSIVFITILSIVKAKTNDFPLPLFITFVIILLLFPVASWFNSYFSKKQKTKMLNNYEQETELILKFMQHRKHYKAFDESDKIYITVSFNEYDELNKYTYNVENSSLGFPETTNAFISIGVGFVGLEVDPTTHKVISIKGLLPKSIWLKKRLNLPTSIKGQLTITPHGVDLRSKTYLQTLKQGDTYYDKHLGLLCIGERKTYPIDETIEFLDGAYLTIREGKVVSLWITVSKDLNIY